MKCLIFDQRLWWNTSIWIITVMSQLLDHWSTAEISPRRMHYKNARNIYRLIAIRRSWCIFRQFNIDRYNSSWSRVEIKRQSDESDLATYPPSLKWRSTTLICRAIGRSIGYHIASSHRPLIATRLDAPDRATLPAHF